MFCLLSDNALFLTFRNQRYWSRGLHLNRTNFTPSPLSNSENWMGLRTLKNTIPTQSMTCLQIILRINSFLTQTRLCYLVLPPEFATQMTMLLIRSVIKQVKLRWVESLKRWLAASNRNIWSKQDERCYPNKTTLTSLKRKASKIELTMLPCLRLSPSTTRMQAFCQIR